MSSWTFFRLEGDTKNESSICELLNKKRFKPIIRDAETLVHESVGWCNTQDKEYLSDSQMEIVDYKVNYGNFKLFGMRTDKLVLPAAVKEDMKARISKEFPPEGLRPKEEKLAYKVFVKEETERLLREQTPNTKVVPIYMFDNVLAVGSCSQAVLQKLELLFLLTFDGRKLFPLCAYELVSDLPNERLERLSDGNYSENSAWLRNKNAFIRLGSEFLAWCINGFDDGKVIVYMHDRLSLGDSPHNTILTVKNTLNPSQFIDLIPSVKYVGLCCVFNDHFFDFCLDNDFFVKGLRIQKIKGQGEDEKKMLEAQYLETLHKAITELFDRFIESKP